MKLSVLVDNNTLIDHYFLGEPAASFYIEDEGEKILFDTGYSDAFLRNGIKMGVDFRDLDYLVISHSHLDHTWGMDALVRLLAEEMFEGRIPDIPVFVAHPEVFPTRTVFGFPQIGMNMSRDRVEDFFPVKISSEPVKLTDRLWFLGEIPRNNDFEGLEPIGEMRGGEKDGQPDFMMDDSALVWEGPDGLVIISGCSHSGICNITDYSMKVTGTERIADIIGGFHLQDPSEERLRKTGEYFRQVKPAVMHPSHCTDLKSKIFLASFCRVEETGSGHVLTY